MKPLHKIAILLAGALLLVAGLTQTADATDWKTVDVSVSAYNAVASQTKDDEPAVTAWGDVLKPGMRAIAVSRDLIRKGLTYGTRVRIEGLKGVYVVRDKMNKRWHEKIDVYMGRNVTKARDWGVKDDVSIRYAVADDE